MNRLLLLAALITLAAPAARADHIWINEFHYDNPGTDVNEFVEVAVRTGPAFTLADYSVILYNGSNGLAYDTRSLSTYTASAPFPVANSTQTVTFYSFNYTGTPSGGIQNGAPDAIAIVNTVTNTVVQFISYEGTFAAVDGPAAGMTSVDVGVFESGAAGSSATTAIGYTGYSGGLGGSAYALLATQTPGAPNAGQTLSAPITQALDDTAGWRLLSAPVTNVTVETLAGINLVQSVTGQYPTYPTDNLYTSYTGGGTTGLVAAVSSTDAVLPGRGFFWYLFDRDITPDPMSFGGGTSRSYALPARLLSANGPVNTANVSQTFAVTQGFYMAGNPFGQALAATGVTQTAGGGTFATNLQLYNPVSGYTFVNRTTATDLSTWQGFFAEVQNATGPVTLTYLAASRTTGTPELVGRAAGRVVLALDGQLATAAGAAPSHDEAAAVDFAADALVGWDAGDASKLTPPTDAYALVAVLGELNGAARQQAIRSLPVTEAETTVDVAFTATHAGSFELSASLPAGWSARLTDRTANTTADLAAGAYAFTAEAGDWSNRFALTLTPARTTASETGAATFALGAVFPNPATAAARLALRVDAAQAVTATVVDALGRTVQTVFEGSLGAGASQDLTVDTSGLAPGLYIVRVTGETFTATRRLVVAR